MVKVTVCEQIVEFVSWCLQFGAFPEHMVSVAVRAATEYACGVLTECKGFVVWCPWETSLYRSKRVGSVSAVKGG